MVYKMMMEIHWLKDTMNQLVDCKIDMMMWVTRMSETALLEPHRLMAAGPGCMTAGAQPTHKRAENQNYTTRELGRSWGLLRARMRVTALLKWKMKNSNKKYHFHLLLELEGSHTGPGQVLVGSWPEQQWREEGEADIAQQVRSPRKKGPLGRGRGRGKKAGAAGGGFI